MDKEFVELEVSMTMSNRNAAIKDAEDLAWEHTKEFASDEKIEMSSEAFAEVFKLFNDRYTHQVDHMKFFMLSAMLTVRHMVEGNILQVPATDGDKPDEREVSIAIAKASQLLVTSYMWLSAGYEIAWPANDELPENLVVKYMFEADKIKESKEPLDDIQI